MDDIDVYKLDLGALKIFLEVYRTGSITLAADNLKMSQPGVSTSLRRLQTQLGVSLFAKQGRSIIPTQKGISFAEQIENSLSILGEAVGALHSFSTHSSRTFKILVNEAMLHILQPKIDKDTSLNNVKIILHPLPINENTVEELLSLSQYDLAIDIYSPQSPSFQTERLYSERFVVVCNRDHPRIQHSITQEGFLNEKHIVIMLRRSNLSLAEKFTSFAFPDREVTTVCSSLIGALYLASMSENLCLSSPLLTQQAAKELPIQYMDFPFECTPINHTMIWHKRNDNIGSNQWLRSKLKEYLEESI